MNIIIAGGSGFIGRPLCQALRHDGHQVTVLSRNPQKAAKVLGPSVTTIAWDVGSPGTWEHVLHKAEAVINLAGEPIADARWTDRRKRQIRDSRVLTTQTLVDALAKVSDGPRILVNASGVGFYGPRVDPQLTEASPIGTGFLAELCAAWEHEASLAESHGVRVVILRIGMVLGKHGGALAQMIRPFRLFVGGPISPGDQWVSWIHIRDLIGLVQWALSREHVKGPVNAVSPTAVTMEEFCQVLGRVLKRPSWLQVPQFALRFALGELSSLLTTGQRVIPKAAMEGGYVFQYSDLEPALLDILSTHPRSGRATERAV